MTQAEQTPWHTPSWFTSPWNHEPSVAGRLAFPPNIEIHDVTLRDADRTEALPYLPELVGQAGRDVVMGKGSGVDNVADWLDRASIGASEDQRLDILQRVKVLSLAHKRLLTGDEFESIALSVTGDLPGPSGGDG